MPHRKTLKDFIVNVDFPDREYYHDKVKKSQIVLHHTASGGTPHGDIRYWEGDKTPNGNIRHVATPVIVGRDGAVFRLYSSSKWAHHIGVKHHVFDQHGIKRNAFNKSISNNTWLNMTSVGCEIDSWGGLIKRGSSYYNWVGGRVPYEDVIHYPNGFRGYKYYEKYTPEQIESTRLLLQYWGDYYRIPLGYSPRMWDVSEAALKGIPGVWSHTSYRADKSDCHPRPELIEMLKSLNH